MANLVPPCTLTEADIRSALDAMRSAGDVDGGWLLIGTSSGRLQTAIIESARVAGYSAEQIDTGEGVAINLNGRSAQDFRNAMGRHNARELYEHIHRCNLSMNETPATGTAVAFTGTEFAAYHATLPKVTNSAAITLPA